MNKCSHEQTTAKLKFQLITVMLRINDQPVPEAAIDFDFSAVAEFLNENFKGIEVRTRTYVRVLRV